MSENLTRQERRWNRRQRRLEALSAALQAGVRLAREMKRRFWPSLLIAVILDRDYEPVRKRPDGSRA